MPTTITRERPDTPDARALIEALEGELEPFYPSTSRHGYSIEKLLAEDVAFFVIRHEGAAAGCGGVKLFGVEYGEVKRMYMRPAWRGLGLARLMLEHLENYVRGNGVIFCGWKPAFIRARLSASTSAWAFGASHRLASIGMIH